MNYQTTVGSFAEKSDPSSTFPSLFLPLYKYARRYFWTSLGSKTTLDPRFSCMDKRKEKHFQKCKCTSIIYCQNISGKLLGVVHWFWQHTQQEILTFNYQIYCEYIGMPLRLIKISSDSLQGVWEKCQHPIASEGGLSSWQKAIMAASAR